MSFTKKQIDFMAVATSWAEVNGKDLSSVDKHDLQDIADSVEVKFPHWITRVPTYRVGRGLWMVPVDGAPAIKAVADSSVGVEKAPDPITVTDKPTTPAVVDPVVEMAKGTNDVAQSHVPAKDDLFVPFGSFTDMVLILKSEMFYPVFVTGLSGNGKTLMIDQACAKASRALYRVNITIETDEDDLLGGFRLVDGETVWFDGPVIEAMRTGSVLLLDEVDLASTKIMCLQPILEGKGVFLKKINEYVDCQPGFNIVATANTKGKGDDTGNFIGAGVLNEAFLERFPITVEQDYPATPIEKKILGKVFDSLSISDNEFIEKLVSWADIIRKTYQEGAIDELITTRRLVHISNAYAIFSMDRMKAIEMCVNRFDDETKTAMVDLYTKVDGAVDPNATDDEDGTVDEVSTDAKGNDAPF
jgi:MoxR-like ATPase